MNPALPHATLVDALRHAECFPHPVSRIEVLETHISWVILTGQYAYKIKKPVDLGFLDFSTLEKRRLCCMEELRLNRRHAPQLYLDVVGITGTSAQPAVSGKGPMIEYAVKMRQFAQDALASRLLAAGKLTPRCIGKFAATLYAFHAAAAPAGPADGFGTAQGMLELALQNFSQLAALPGLHADKPALEFLRVQTLHEHRRQHALFETRIIAGAVRECHGDLHLGNIVLVDGALVPFDCIEFNAALRWNDVMSEVAFLVMDLHDRRHPELAWLFLNAYLECSGDYGGLALLRYYLVYRAMVRAKVHGIRAHQTGISESEQQRLLGSCRGYLDLASAFCRHERPTLVITHGLSGSGKSRITNELMQQCGGIRIRSDVERKRCHGLSPMERGSSAVGSGMYDERSTRGLYERLAELAGGTLAAGYTTIIDASFLKHWQRNLARKLAQNAGAALLVVDVTAPESVLRRRVGQRAAEGKDASDAGLAVLEHQIATREPLSAQERLDAVTVSSEVSDPRTCCEPLLGALRRLGT